MNVNGIEYIIKYSIIPSSKLSLEEQANIKIISDKVNNSDLDFGTLFIDKSESKQQIIQLRNTSSISLPVIIDTANLVETQYSTTCGSTLNRFRICTITLKLDSEGKANKIINELITFSGKTINILGSYLLRTEQEIKDEENIDALSKIQINPQIGLNLGDAEVNKIVKKQVIIKNNSISNIVLNVDYSTAPSFQIVNGCQQEISRFRACTIDIYFDTSAKPTGIISENIVIAGNLYPLSVNVMGDNNGISEVTSVNDLSLNTQNIHWNFVEGNQEGNIREVVVANNKSEPLHLNTLNEQFNGSHFILLENNCLSIIPPMSTCSFKVDYNLTPNGWNLLEKEISLSNFHKIKLSGIIKPISMLAAGSDGTCGVVDGETMYCWGRNNYKQTSDSNESYIQSPFNLRRNIYNQISIGAYHKCAIHSMNGKIYCWGHNTFGQLGIGNTDNKTEMNAVSAFQNVFEPIVKLESSLMSNCALLVNNSVYCWGRNSFGELGLGHLNPIGDNESADTSSLLNFEGNKIKELSSSSNSNKFCAISIEGKLFCWGSNSYISFGDGILGDSSLPREINTPNPVSMVANGLEHSCALFSDKTIRCVGRNNYGQLGRTRPNPDVEVLSYSSNETIVSLTGFEPIKVVAGKNFTCALSANGNVRCWGDNGKGQIGNSSISVNLNIGDEVKDIVAGGEHTCFLNNNNQYKCIGGNTYGQSGNGTNVNITDPTLYNFLDLL